MPTVKSSHIASFVSGYYGYTRYKGGFVRVGLNMSSSDLLSVVECDSSANPGCVDVPINVTSGAGYIRAWFTATFIPSSDYTLTRLSLAGIGPPEHEVLTTPLMDIAGFSIQLKAGAQYTVVIEEEVTYPTTIVQQT